jgi:hypothetical protein
MQPKIQNVGQCTAGIFPLASTRYGVKSSGDSAMIARLDQPQIPRPSKQWKHAREGRHMSYGLYLEPLNRCATAQLLSHILQIFCSAQVLPTTYTTKLYVTMAGIHEPQGAANTVEKSDLASHDETISPASATTEGDNQPPSEGLQNIEDDPHRAALEDNVKRKLPAKTWAAVFFLGFTFQPALAFSILGVFPIISVIADDIQGSTLNSAWMSSGWTLGGTIAFAIAGRVSDVFGRRYVLLFGQCLLIISYVSS